MWEKRMHWNYGNLGCKCLKCIRGMILQGIYWILWPFSTYPFWSIDCLITILILCFIESKSRRFNTPLVILFWCNTVYLSSNLPYLGLHSFPSVYREEIQTNDVMCKWTKGLTIFSVWMQVIFFLVCHHCIIMCYSKDWLSCVIQKSE